MRLKGEPGRTVHKKVRKPGGRYRMVALFRFDADGYAEIDEKKLSFVDQAKLLRKFKRVEESYDKMGYQDLQKVYSEKTGKSAVGMKKADMLKEL